MKTAIVLIHGIGEQRPTETLRKFVDEILPGPKHTKDLPKFYSKPDRVTNLTDVRFLSDSRKDSMYDFYEFYWAHRVKQIDWKQVLFWLLGITFKPESRLTKELRNMRWRLIWSVILLITVGTLFVLGAPEWFKKLFDFVANNLSESPEQNQGRLLWTGLSICLGGMASVLGAWTSYYLIKYVGDAQQYLVPQPKNIKVRQEIREAGLKLLRRLHDPSFEYERIVIVGHSLGSVIGYDLIKHLWLEFNDRQRKFPHFPERELDKLGANMCIDSSQEDQKKLWEIQKRAVQKHSEEQKNLLGIQNWAVLQSNDAIHYNAIIAWLISDFITLGSPLAHAQVLMARDENDLKTRQADRELPKCPPVDNDPQVDNGKSVGDGKKDKEEKEQLGAFYKYKDFLVPHHAAPFVCTQWTNIYFPGDMIGGPLEPVFGKCIKDVEASSRNRRAERKLRSHTRYWDSDMEGNSALEKLRNLLGTL